MEYLFRTLQSPIEFLTNAATARLSLTIKVRLKLSQHCKFNVIVFGGMKNVVLGTRKRQREFSKRKKLQLTNSGNKVQFHADIFCQ